MLFRSEINMLEDQLRGTHGSVAVQGADRTAIMERINALRKVRYAMAGMEVPAGTLAPPPGATPNGAKPANVTRIK